MRVLLRTFRFPRSADLVAEEILVPQAGSLLLRLLQRHLSYCDRPKLVRTNAACRLRSGPQPRMCQTFSTPPTLLPST